MHLICVVPGWHAAVLQRSAARTVSQQPSAIAGTGLGVVAGADEAWTAPADERDLIWRVQRDAAPCWWTATLHALGLDTASAPDGAPAANDWVERTGRSVPAGLLLRADPVSLQADRDSAILHPPGALLLDEAQSARLVVDLNAFLADDGLALHAVTPTDWYLCGAGLPMLRGASPDALAFRSLETSHLAPGQLVGADEQRAQRRLRTLQSELEMMLHAHPLNAERRATARPAITGLHLWGASGAWSPAAQEPTPRVDAVVGDAAFVRCAAAAAGVPSRDELFDPAAPGSPPGGSLLLVDLSMRDPWLRADAAALEQARMRFIECRLEPLRAAGVDPVGMRIIAEAGWCHTVQAPPRLTPGAMIARVRRLLLRRGKAQAPPLTR